MFVVVGDIAEKREEIGSKGRGVNFVKRLQRTVAVIGLLERKTFLLWIFKILLYTFKKA